MIKANLTLAAVTLFFVASVSEIDARSPSPQRVFEAACYGNAEPVQRALARGFSVDERAEIMGITGTPLFFTAACPGVDTEDRLKIASLLIAAGADVNAPGVFHVEQPIGMTPLIAAAYSVKPGLLHLLLENGARVDEGDPMNQGTAMHWAAEVDCAACIRFLLRHGARPDVRNAQALTPLFIAAYLGFTDTVEVLLEAGADPNPRDARGTGVLEVVEDEEVMAMLKGARREQVAKYVVLAIFFAGLLAAGAYFWAGREDPV